MGVFGALYAAVSGLNADSNNLGVISDNIANSNTVGYKDTTTNFSTLVTASGSADIYSPGGVTSTPFYNVGDQGVLQAESSPTDLAISGGGFFVVDSNAATTGTLGYTRAGNFTMDANGNLVNAAGYFLQGQALTTTQAAQALTGNVANLLTTTQPNLLQTVNISRNAGTANPTANVSLVANLPANTPGGQTLTVPVYDSLGVQHDMTLTFTPTGTANQWSVAAAFVSAGTSTATITAGDNLVQFNANGTLNTAGTTFNAANALTIAWDPAITSATSPQKLTFNLGTNGTTTGLSQIGTNFNVGQITQDGVQFGNFSGVQIDQNGIVTAHYDNGIIKALYIVPLATYSDVNQLQPIDGNVFLESPASGTPVLRQPKMGSAGAIAPSSLENSTVDIATEFSNLIITQRAYEANSKIITTADQMLQTLIQAKQ